MRTSKASVRIILEGNSQKFATQDANNNNNNNNNNKTNNNNNNNNNDNLMFALFADELGLVSKWRAMYRSIEIH